MSNNYTPLHRRVVTLRPDDKRRSLTLNDARVDNKIATAIRAVAAQASTLRCVLQLADEVVVLGRLANEELPEFLRHLDPLDDKREISDWLRCLFNGMHPLAALKAVALSRHKQGYVCPSCGEMHALDVDYTGSCTLVQSDSGTLEGTKSSPRDAQEWHAVSPARCRSCGYAAELSAFDAADLDRLLKVRIGLQQRHVGHIAGQCA